LETGERELDSVLVRLDEVSFYLEVEGSTGDADRGFMYCMGRKVGRYYFSSFPTERVGAEKQ
jgi:hypothetical protein